MVDMKSVVATEIGQTHIYEGIPCQDNTLYKRGEDVIVVALSDGAGSYAHSEIVSNCVVKWATDYFCGNFERIYQGLDEDFGNLRHQIISDVHNYFDNNGLQETDGYCTLLVTAIHKDGRWISAHIGDGIIFRVSTSAEILSSPENGEYPNITFFINEAGAEKHLRLYRGKEETTCGFLLTSDGCSNSLYDVETRIPAEAVDVMVNWLVNNDEQEVEEALSRELKTLFSMKSDDDLSIGIVCRTVGRERI